LTKLSNFVQIRVHLYIQERPLPYEDLPHVYLLTGNQG